MKLNRKLFLPMLLTLSCFSAPAFAQSDAGKRSFPEIGPEVEVYVPFSSKTRDRFGSTFTGIGIGFGSAVPRTGGQIRPDIAIVRAESGRNEALFIAGGLQYRRTFVDQVAADARYVPYYGAGLNLMYGKVETRARNRDEDDFGAGASVFVGTSVGRRAFVEGRLRGLNSVNSYNFSGLALTAGLRF